MENGRIIRIIILIGCIAIALKTSKAIQPKILKVTDNLGHTYTYEDSQSEGAIRSISINEKLLVTENTTITLCVEKVEKDKGDDVKFSYESGIRPHPDNMESWKYVNDPCHTWNLDKEDYSANWWFDVRITNEDEIDYIGSTGDMIARFIYNNLEISEDSDSETVGYNIIKIEKSEYKSLKEKVSSLENKNKKLDETINQKEGKISELESKIESLNNTLSSLRDRVDSLLSRLNQKNETINQLDSKADKWKIKAKNLNKTLKEERKPDNPISGFFTWVGSWV